MSQTALLAALKSIVGEANVLTDPADMETYVNEERGLFRGSPLAVARPGSTEEVAAVVKACAEAGIAIVPQGGNTGLVGGGLADGEVIVATGRLNRIRALNPEDFTMTVEAGCVLEDIRNAAEKVDRLFPLSLGAQGSCQIGGNISTNVGGINTLRYGTARDNVLGLEVVLPDGRIWNGLRALTKDNTGYSLRNLFVGAEGTLGIVTAAVLKLYPKPVQMETAFCALESPEAALELLARARRASGDQVAAFELICRDGLRQSVTYMEGLSDPLDAEYPWYVLTEFTSANPEEPLRDTFEGFLGAALEDGVILDAVLAESLEQRRSLWRIREELPEAEKYEGGSIKHDISVPVRCIPEFIRRATAAVLEFMPGSLPVPFGHAGDGNIHFNVTQPKGMPVEEFFTHWHPMSRIVYDIVDELNGSFSAEHGVGRFKIEYLKRYRSEVELDMMHRIKAALDPQNIMNPGALFGPPLE